MRIKLFFLALIAAVLAVTVAQTPAWAQSPIPGQTCCLCDPPDDCFCYYKTGYVCFMQNQCVSECAVT